MNPPIVPWLDTLPVFEESVTTDGIGVYVGVVNDIENICVQILDGELHVLMRTFGEGSRTIWHYDEDSDTIIASPAEVGSGYGEAIVEGAGFEAITAGIGVRLAGLNKGNIAFKILSE